MFCFWTLLFALAITYWFLDYLLRLFKVDNFGDKHVLITGCDSGFGRLLAMRLDSLGFNVFAACLTEEGAKSLKENSSNKLVTVILDVTKASSRETTLELVKQQLPANKGLWALVNNAGIAGQLAPLEMLTKEDFTSVLEVNLLGPIEMTRLFLPLIKKTKGRVVNITSVAGRVAFPFYPYSVSKFGLEGFSDTLRREQSSQGVKVSILEPGAFLTPIANAEAIMANVQKAYDRSSSEVQASCGGDKCLERRRKTMANSNQNASPQLHLVIDAYVHAITAKFPRIRYVVGNDARWIFMPLTYLPDWLCDFFFVKIF